MSPQRVCELDLGGGRTQLLQSSTIPILLYLDDLIPSFTDVLEGVAAVDDQGRPLGDGGGVEGSVIGNEEDAVGGATTANGEDST